MQIIFYIMIIANFSNDFQLIFFFRATIDLFEFFRDFKFQIVKRFIQFCPFWAEI